MTGTEAMHIISIVRELRRVETDSCIARRLEVELCCEVLRKFNPEVQIFPTVSNSCVRAVCLGILSNRPFEGFHPWRLP